MPRPLVFGNGSILIGLDTHYAIRDLFYPQVGQYNHLNGYSIRLGVWVNEEFDWVDGDAWTKELGYRPNSLVGHSIFVNERLGIRLEIEEAVHHQSPAFIRRIRVINLRDEIADIRLFSTQDLRIMETDIGDTAFYNPFVDAMIHYKGPHYFLFGGSTSQGGIEQYATGIKGFAGMEGTWRDAEDGQLSQNPIAQGSVDSTFGIRMTVKGKKSGDALFWIVCGKKLDDVSRTYQELLAHGISDAIEEIDRYWKAWSDKRPFGLENLPEPVQTLYTRSLLTIRTQIDNQGAILAANDSDIMATNRATYSYMWPRDGALVASVMNRAGYQHIARKFFRFCRGLLSKDRPILLHKYMPDGSVGASWHPWTIDGRPEMPFQEDETALTVAALWDNYVEHEDLEFLSEMYESFVVPTCEFMNRYRDPQSGLPLPSYDLWEERRGVHTFTVSSVIAAMKAAAKIAKAIGDDRAETFQAASEELVVALKKHMYDDQRGVFYRRLAMVHGGYEPDRVVDSAVLSVLLMGALPPDDPMVLSTIKVIEKTLRLNSGIDGYARYEGDYYFRTSDQHPGNPWIICTLWVAQAKILTAKSRADLKEPQEWLEWTARQAAVTGILPEQFHPESGTHLSVSPLTWSHAEFIHTVLEYCRRYQDLQ